MNVKELTPLVKNVRDNLDNNSYLELKTEVQNCYYDVYHRYKYKLYESGVSRQDSFDDIDFVLLKSIRTFDENRDTKFSTHFTNYSFYHFKRLLSSKDSLKHRYTSSLEYDDYDVLNLEELCTDSDNPEKLTEFSDLRKKIFDIINEVIKNEKQKMCLIEKFFSGDSAKSNLEISKTLNIDAKYVSQLIREGLEKIRERLKFEERVDQL